MRQAKAHELNKVLREIMFYGEINKNLVLGDEVTRPRLVNVTYNKNGKIYNIMGVMKKTRG